VGFSLPAFGAALTVGIALITPMREQANHLRFMSAPMPATRRCGGEHLLSPIEGTLDIARIESGKLTLDIVPMRFADGLHEMQDKGIRRLVAI
jgi:hypothetical protein